MSFPYLLGLFMLSAAMPGIIASIQSRCRPPSCEMLWATLCIERSFVARVRLPFQWDLGVRQRRQPAGKPPSTLGVHGHAAAQVALPAPPFGRVLADEHLLRAGRRRDRFLPDPALEPFPGPHVGRPGPWSAQPVSDRRFVGRRKLAPLGPGIALTPRLPYRHPELEEGHGRDGRLDRIGPWPGSRRSCCGARWCGFQARRLCRGGHLVRDPSGFGGEHAGLGWLWLGWLLLGL